MTFVFLIFAAVFSPSSFAVIGSISDPSFFSEEQPVEPFFGFLKGSFKTQIFRNIRRKPNKNWFFDDSLSIKSDLIFSYSLNKKTFASQKNYFFNEADLFFVISYERPIYAVIKKINPHCFKQYFCFSDINVGVSKAFLKEDYLNGNYAFYLSLPFISKFSLNQSKIFEMGASLIMQAPFFSAKKIQMGAVSSHFMDIGIFSSRWGNKRKTYYNEKFSLFNQMGLKFSYAGSSFFPFLLVYASHRFSLNFKKAPSNRMSLGFSSIWSVNKKLRLMAGLNWGDRIFKPKYTSQALKIRFFSPDITFVNAGFSYSF